MLFRSQVRDGVTLNLSGASVAEASRLILGELLRVNYVVSDKVKGSITIQTVRPIPRAGLLEVFESLLRTEGAAIVVENGLHKVVPAAEAINAAPLRGRGPSLRRGPGVSTQILPLQYVAAAEMERILKAIAPQAQVLRVDSARNLLVLAGSRTELEAMIDAVTTFDVDWMRGMSFAIHPIESGDPEAIAQELDTIFANDQIGRAHV